MPDDEKKPEPKNLQQIIREAWMSAMSSAEAEWQKATTRMMEALGVPEGGNLRDEIVARVKKQREEFERRVDDGVRTAMQKVRAPIDKELATLKSRVEQIQTKIEEQKKARAEKKKAPPKTEKTEKGE